MSKKIIAVTGATGAQGGGLVRAILEEGEFAVRAITRKVESDKARELARLGAEVVAADLDDVESLVRAFEGAYGAYCVTNFWEHFSAEKEVAQARNMAEAARRTGVKHVVWSTLEDTRRDVPLSDDRMPTLQGKYKVPHFDGKGEADAVFKEAGVPTTYFRVAFYWENMIYFGMGPRRAEGGQLQLNLPMGDKKLSGIAAEDIGRCAYGVFKRPSMIGQVVGVAGDEPTGDEMAAVFSRVLGEPVVYAPLTPAQFRALGFAGADDLGNMFQYYQDFEAALSVNRSVALSRELNPKLLNFEQWAKKYASLIPVEASAQA